MEIQVSTLTTMLFFITTVITLYMYYSKGSYCPPKKCIETRALQQKIIPTVDIQFSEQNFPSVVYNDIFSGDNVWQGGYKLLNTGKGTTSPTQNGIAQRPVVSVSGFVPGG